MAPRDPCGRACPTESRGADCDACAAALRVHAETTRILATHLRAVIERTQEAAEEIVSSMTRTHEEVQSIVGALRAATDESHQRYEHAPNTAVAEGMSGLSAALVHKNALLDELGARAAALAARSMDGLAGLQFQDIVRQRLELVLDVLEKLDAHIANVAAHAAGGHVDVLAGVGELDAAVMAGRYVMRAQRDDHDRATGAARASADDGPDIELF